MSILVPLDSNRHCLDHHSYWGIRIVVIIAQGILNCPAIGWVSSHSFHHGPWQKRLTSISTQLNLETSCSYPYSWRVTPEWNFRRFCRASLILFGILAMFSCSRGWPPKHILLQACLTWESTYRKVSAMLLMLWTFAPQLSGSLLCFLIQMDKCIYG